MPGSGSCACGNVAFEYAGDPALTALCHCTDCQKFCGSAFASNVAVPTANFTLRGTPKSWSRTALHSGKEHAQFFCDKCGSSLFSRAEGMPGLTLIKTGSLLDTDIKIKAELFVSRRRGYVNAVEGAKQASEML